MNALRSLRAAAPGLVALAMVMAPCPAAALEPLLKVEGRDAAVFALAADGRTAFLAHANGVDVWDTASKKKSATIKDLARNDFYPAAASFAASADGKRFALITDPADAKTGKGRSVVVWDVAAAKALLTAPVADFRCLTLSPDGRTLVVVAKTAEFIDVATGDRTKPLGDQLDAATSLAFAADGKSLAAAKKDVISIWEVASRQHRTLWSPPSGRASSIESLAFSADGKRLAAGLSVTGCGGAVWIDTATGRDVTVLAAGLPFSTVVVCGGADYLWLQDPSTPTSWKTLWKVGGALPSFSVLDGHLDAALAVAFAPDGKTLASGGADKTVRLWDVEARKQRAALTGHRGLVLALAFTKEGTLASGGGDGAVRLWDAAAAKERALLVGHQGPVWCLAPSPDGALLASGGHDKTVRLWDIAAAKQVETLPQRAEVYALAISPDGQTLAAGTAAEYPLPSKPRSVALWDIPSRKAGVTIADGDRDWRLEAVAFGADGSLLGGGLAAGKTNSTGVLSRWDVTTGKRVEWLRFRDRGVASCLALTPDGKRLVAGYHAEVNANTRTCFIQMVDKAAAEPWPFAMVEWQRATALALSPDGATLAVATNSGQVVLWRLPPPVTKD